MNQKSRFIKLVEEWNESKLLILLVPESPITYIVHTLDIIRVEPDKLYDRVWEEFTSLVQDYGYSTDNAVITLVKKPDDKYQFGKELECTNARKRALCVMNRKRQ